MIIEPFVKTGNYTYQRSKITIDVFKRLTITRQYSGFGSFNLDIQINNLNDIFSTQEIVNLLTSENVLLIDGVYYYIDRAVCEDAQSGVLTVSGKSLGYFMDNRIIKDNLIKTGKPEKIMWDIINTYCLQSDDKFKIDFLTLSPFTDLGSSSIQYQNSYGNIREQIELLCDTYDIGIKENSSSTSLVSNQLSFYKGSDVSNVVEFSVKNENIMSESYENSTFDSSTTAYVFGEGEGTNRKLVIVNDGNVGMGRKELYVDARDLQQENMTDAQYIDALTNKGKEKLSKKQEILIINGDINPNDTLYVYGRDYSIGDIVSVKSETFGLTNKARLLSMVQTFDEKGVHFEPTIGKQSPTQYDILKRK